MLCIPSTWKFYWSTYIFKEKSQTLCAMNCNSVFVGFWLILISTSAQFYSSQFKFIKLKLYLGGIWPMYQTCTPSNRMKYCFSMWKFWFNFLAPSCFPWPAIASTYGKQVGSIKHHYFFLLVITVLWLSFQQRFWILNQDWNTGFIEFDHLWEIILFQLNITCRTISLMFLKTYTFAIPTIFLFELQLLDRLAHCAYHRSEDDYQSEWHL